MRRILVITTAVVVGALLLASLIYLGSNVRIEQREVLVIAETNPLSELIRNSASTADIQHLMEQRPSLISKADYSGWLPIHYAVMLDNVSVLKMLIQSGADPNAAVVGDDSTQGYTPLHVAALYGHYVAAEVLIDAGADSRRMTSAGESPISLAEERENDQLTQFLKRHD